MGLLPCVSPLCVCAIVVLRFTCALWEIPLFHISTFYRRMPVLPLFYILLLQRPIISVLGEISYILSVYWVPLHDFALGEGI